MWIILNEIKKMCTIKNLLILLLINFIGYYIAIEFRMTYFPNGNPSTNIYSVSKKIIEERGNDFSDSDKEYLEDMYKHLLSVTGKYLENNEIARKYGVKDVRTLVDKAYTAGGVEGQELGELNNKIFFKEGVEGFWDYEAVSWMRDMYNNNENSLKLSKLPHNADRIDEIIKNKEFNSILPSEVIDNYNEVIVYSFVTILLSVVFVISPVFTYDKRRNMEYVQYSSKRGRRIFKDKVIASIISGIGITTTILGWVFYLYNNRKNTVEMFYDSSINSFFSGYSWINITFREYMIISIVLLYLTVISVTILICYVSRLIGGYIPLIGIMILITYGIEYVVNGYILKYIFNIYRFKFLEVFVLGGFIIIGATLIYTRYRKELKIDIN